MNVNIIIICGACARLVKVCKVLEEGVLKFLLPCLHSIGVASNKRAHPFKYNKPIRQDGLPKSVYIPCYSNVGLPVIPYFGSASSQLFSNLAVARGCSQNKIEKPGGTIKDRDPLHGIIKQYYLG